MASWSRQWSAQSAVRGRGGLIACCGIDSLRKRVLDFGILERQEMYGLVLPGSHLGPAARERARTCSRRAATRLMGCCSGTHSSTPD